MKVFRIAILVFLGVSFVFWYPEKTFSQSERRRVEEEARQDLASTETAAGVSTRQVLLDYGAWLNYRYIKYRDDDNDSLTEDTLKKRHWIDSRLWMKLALAPALGMAAENEYYVYLRIKDLMKDDTPKETAGGWDHDGPHVEYAYVNCDIRPFWVKLGRQYFSVGEGFAYSGVYDGVEALFLSPRWSVQAFAANTLPHEDNIDTSVPGYDKTSDRYFYGLEYNYSGFSGHLLI